MFKGGKRDVCCLQVEEGRVGMININIKSKHLKGMHIILNGKNDNWNYIGKWWLKSMTKSIIRNIFLLHAQTLKVCKFIHYQYITKGE